jgi:D-aminopeptidase
VAETRLPRKGRRLTPARGASRLPRMRRTMLALALALLPLSAPGAESRPRARDLGLRPGAHPSGPLDAITDVPGVRVGHATVIEGEAVRTGVTAVLPHDGNLFAEKVAGAVDVFNAFGKLVGSTQVEELGQIETPILLTNTLSVWDAAAALADWMLARPGNAAVRSINPLVGETNDGWLSEIRGRHVKAAHVREALESASAGPVAEGAVGAGTGTRAFGWKGGIGTASRHVSAASATVGVLVQANFGGRLTMDGVPVWRELQPEAEMPPPADGSCMIVVATDAPLDARQLRRLATRAALGLGRAGSSGSSGSGDYAIAFSTARRFGPRGEPLTAVAPPAEESLSPLFEAVIEATEEAVLNALLRATTVRGRDGHLAEAIPIERLREVLKRHGRI